MTRRRSNSQWSGGITAHPAYKNSECKNPLEKFSPQFFGMDQAGILFIDYLPKGQTINAEYYLSLLVQVKDIWKERRCRKVTKVVLFLHDSVLAQPAIATQKKLACQGFQRLYHPPYSLDLAPSDYHLFSGLKKQLKCRHFSSDTEVIAAAETWLHG
jgi:histone-lysine N-methyltransferase SETMAR